MTEEQEPENPPAKPEEVQRWEDEGGAVHPQQEEQQKDEEKSSLNDQ